MASLSGNALSPVGLAALVEDDQSRGRVRFHPGPKSGTLRPILHGRGRRCPFRSRTQSSDSLPASCCVPPVLSDLFKANSTATPNSSRVAEPSVHEELASARRETGLVLDALGSVLQYYG